MDSITDNDKREEKKARNLDMRQARHFSRDHFFLSSRLFWFLPLVTQIQRRKRNRQTVICNNENQFLRFIVIYTRRKVIWVLKLQGNNKRSSQKDKKNLQLTIMKTYGRPTRRFAMANVRTHALTKKATLLAQRLARRRVNVKMKNLTTSRSRPARKVRENNNSHLLKLPLI